MVPKIGEGEARFWDILLKLIGGVVAIVTVWIGLSTLAGQQRQLKVQQQQIASQQNEQMKVFQEE
jgi:hypothetical protein